MLSRFFGIAALICTASAQEIRMESGRFLACHPTLPASEPADGWGSVFGVFAGSEGVPAMLGRYAAEGKCLVFQPRFPLSPGIDLRAVLTLPGRARSESIFRIPQKTRMPSTSVLQVFPSADVIPENQLKFYVQFSAPMSRGEAWQRIRLLQENGGEVDAPFLEIEQELWDPEGKRLTVLIDPGRIKRGLLPLAEAGPALEQGERYTLAIDRDWKDAAGLPLSAPFHKHFLVGEPDRTPPDPALWTLIPPRAGGRAPLVLDFPESLDAALLSRLIYILGPSGEIRGQAVVADHERGWRFVPDGPWAAGDYRVVVDHALEDLAGNRIGRPFDVDTFERITRRIDQRTTELPFRIRQQ